MVSKTIQFLKIFPLRGPSLWAYSPALEAWVDIGELEECPSNTIPGFVERLCAWVPTLAEHRCSYDEPGGFLKRLAEGTWPAHILEHVTLELQSLAGMPGGFGKARSTSVRGVYKVVVRAWQPDVARAAMEAARDLVMAAIEDKPFDMEATMSRLRGMAACYLSGPSTRCIVKAAEHGDRRIPTIRLASHNLVQLGYGANQRRIWAAETELTGAIAEGIARDPEVTHQLLKTCGLPVPTRSRVTSADDAWNEAEEMGLPVFVKPASAISPAHESKVMTRLQMDAAFALAAGLDEGVAVEKTVHGRHHRLLVVGGKMVAAARLNGASGSIHSPDEADDVTDAIHPATAAAACLAAKIVGLNIAGIDMMIEDIARPLGTEHGTIMGMHAAPGLVPHIRPATGEARPVGKAIVESLFPNSEDGRIPVVGITGSVGCTEVARLVGEFLSLSGKHTGVACGDGLFFSRRQVDTGDCGNWQSGRRVLMNRAMEAAVIENGAEVILGQGLPYDRCSVGVITQVIPERHYGTYYNECPEDVFKFIRTQVDVVLPSGVAVLNAADPTAVELAALCDGSVIFFAEDPAQTALASHVANGGKAVTVSDGHIVLLGAGEQTSVVPLSCLPADGAADQYSRVSSALAAVAAAWALGIPRYVMSTGVEIFYKEHAQTSRTGGDAAAVASNQP